MQNLIKVGFTMKDPAIRAKQLNSTGVPHPFVVEYEMLTDNPYEIEQKVHNRLSENREGKEWFNCPAEFAVQVINKVAASNKISEKFYNIKLAKKLPEIKKVIEKKKLHWMSDEKSVSSDIEILETKRNKLNQDVNQKIENVVAIKLEKSGTSVYMLGAIIGLIIFVAIVIDMPYVLEVEPSMTIFCIVIGVVSVWYLLRKKFGPSEKDKIREKIIDDPLLGIEIKELKNQIGEIDRAIEEKNKYIREIRKIINEI